MFSYKKLLELLAGSGYPSELSNADMAKTFTELGMDSLDVYSFFTEIELGLGVKIQDQDIPNLDRLEKVFEYVSDRLSR
jgi:acyl carrier protein